MLVLIQKIGGLSIWPPRNSKVGDETASPSPSQKVAQVAPRACACSKPLVHMWLPNFRQGKLASFDPFQKCVGHGNLRAGVFDAGSRVSLSMRLMPKSPQYNPLRVGLQDTPVQGCGGGQVIL
ncbi:hypothetical protein ACPCDX_24735 [Streptomyces koyangensis]|uniref:hypothetical protein n=1 Tax=Streptomyces koyangensis TaxID=188770 RepID=UPI003C2EF26D